MASTLLVEAAGIIASFLAAASVAVVAVYFYDWTTPFTFKRELSEKDNPAFGVNLAGYVLGVVFVLMGAGAAGPYGPAHPVDIAYYGVLGVGLLRLGALLTNRLTLRRFAVWTEITEKRCLGTGFVTAGAFVATGVILEAALGGDRSGFVSGTAVTLGYFVFSQVLLAVIAAVFTGLTRYRHGDQSTTTVAEELNEQRNPAAGLSFAGFIVGASLVVSAGIGAGDFATRAGIEAAVLTLLLTSALGIGAMLAARPLIDRAVIPYSSLNREIGEQRNLAIAALGAAFYVGLGLILHALMT